VVVSPTSFRCGVVAAISGGQSTKAGHADEATAAAARRVLDWREHGGTLGPNGTEEERRTPTLPVTASASMTCLIAPTW
jgi:hypothetical protein